MLIGTLTPAQAGLGRIHLGPSILVQQLVPFLYFFAWVGYDFVTRRRGWLAPTIGAVMAALIPPLWIPLVARSGPWLAFTAWVIQ